MEDFEIKAINSAEYSLRIGRDMWMTLLWSFSMQGRRSFWSILTTWTHTSSLPLRMQDQMGPLPFLDTIVLPQPDNPLLTSVYRKPMHSDLYL